MRHLRRITVKGFKSIRCQSLKLGDLNVMIGANGAGKSNFVEVFQFLQEVVAQNLQEYSVINGGADTLLFMGRRNTPQAEFKLDFVREAGSTARSYELQVMGTRNNQLAIQQETAYYHAYEHYPRPYHHSVSQATFESSLKDDDHVTAKEILRYMKSYWLYHFHDTSHVASVRTQCKIHDNHYLKPQAENLAAFLYGLQETQPIEFDLIQTLVRQIAPFFEAFQLEPQRLNPNFIRLEWKERYSRKILDAMSMSDGTLRFICLSALLLQPDPPPLVLLDEPELGLHPHAIGTLAGMLRSASQKIQLVVATQSVTLVNQLSPADVWCVDRVEGACVFHHLKDRDFGDWLEDYALGDLWEKNLMWQEGDHRNLGGVP